MMNAAVVKADGYGHGAKAGACDAARIVDYRLDETVQDLAAARALSVAAVAASLVDASRAA
jgi:alanine racemase